MTIAQLFSEEVIQALGWTVVHSLWQAALLAAGAGVGMLLMHRRPARERYLLAVSALVGILVWAMVTFSSYYQPVPETIGMSVIAPDAPFLLPAEAAINLDNPGLMAQFSDYFSRNAPLIVTCWMLGMTFFLLKMLGALLYANQLKRRHVKAVSEKWQQVLRRFTTQIGIRRTVQLLESAVIKTPMTIGFLKPVVLLPIGMVNNLSPGQVEAVLAHELAHIYRCDFLVNIFQAMVETLFYFNPAVWWLSAAIRAEREDCCDDIAIRHCNNSLDYAKALVSVQEWGQDRPHFALAFSGSKNRLLNRVRRILNHPQNKSNIMEKFTATCVLLLAVLVLTISAAYPDSHSPDQPDACEEASVANVCMTKDSLPKGNAFINMEKEGKSLEAKVKNGVITYLKVDGKEIPQADYSQYEDLVEEAFGEVPVPPMPPSAPAAPSSPSSPSFPAPPAPPTPPTPPHFWYGGSNDAPVIIEQKDENGRRFFKIETPGGDEPFNFEWKEGGKVFKMNGDSFNLKEMFPEGMGMNFPAMELQGQLWAPAAEFPMIAGEDMQLKLKQELKLAKQYQKNLNKNKDQLKALRELEKHQKKLSKEQRQQLESARMEMNRAIGAYGQGFSFSPAREGNIRGYFEDGGGRVDRTVESSLENAMVRDGLIRNRENYTLELTGKGMKINGKKQSDEVWEKYKSIYRSASGFELNGKSKIVVDKDNAE